jgi:two-component system sensor histidine kinase YesM
MIIPFVTNFFEQLTFKKRIMFIFVASTIIPFICVVILSYHTMSSILTGNLESSVRSNLRQVQLSLESTISNLNHISQQLAFEGSIGKKVGLLLASADPFERASLTEEINMELNLISFTNPTIGLVMYYFEGEGSYRFNNSSVKADYEIEDLPLLAGYFRISYYGPHVSNERYNDEFVLSALRKMDITGEQNDVYVYIESGFKTTQNILDNQLGEHSYHLILDNDNRIAYSEVPADFPVNHHFNGQDSVKNSGLINGYYWTKGTSNQGWSVVSLIPKDEYNEEKSRWVVQVIYLSFLFVTISLIIAWLLWKMVYRPLQQFNKEIKSMTQSNDNDPVKTSAAKIPEFDFLLNQLKNMKKQIEDLFKEVELKEKRRADLEVEKLLYQINPHFLMNTLDTAHWLAVLNGQKEIDKLVSSLNKLLYYNLGKRGQASTIREEIDSIHQYLNLQQIRYDFKFDVRIYTNEDVLDVSMPRFILQPILENALYHGLNDDGYILVEVNKSGDNVIITVHDNGAGITEEEIDKLLNQRQVEQQKAGMGIGMNYVNRMIENQYGDRAKLEIRSGLGQGMTVFLTIPIMEVMLDDESADRGR